MGTRTGIEYVDATWNPWIGCSRVSEACTNCYAERWAKRCGRDFWKVARASDNTFRMPMSRKRVPPGSFVFVCSWSDFFHEDVPDEWRNEALGMMAFRHDVTFLLLTKRPQKMAEYLGDVSWPEVGGALACEFDRQPTRALRAELEQAVSWLHGEWCEDEEPKPPWSVMADVWYGLPNVWLGVTAENQARADERIPTLLQLDWPGKRFVSLEPMLGPIDLNGTTVGHAVGPCDECESVTNNRACESCDGIASIEWVIAGGESGPGARPMHPDWLRLLRDECQATSVRFCFKSWGEWAPYRPDWPLGLHTEGGYWGGDGKWHTQSCGTRIVAEMTRYGRKTSGRELDGREWLERPEVISPTITSEKNASDGTFGSKRRGSEAK